jgi:excisionase family DNA binding protein
MQKIESTNLTNIAERLLTIEGLLAGISAPPPPDRLMSLDDAADYLGVSRPQIDRLVRLYGLPFFRVGEVKRIERAALLDWARASHGVAEAA